HQQVKSGRHSQGGSHSKTSGNGIQAFLPVKLQILAGIDDVKAGGPKQHNQTEQNGCKLNVTSNSDPRAQRGQTQAQAKKEMRVAGEALGVGIEKQYE